jgi:DNA repair protein RadC
MKGFWSGHPIPFPFLRLFPAHKAAAIGVAPKTEKHMSSELSHGATYIREVSIRYRGAHRRTDTPLRDALGTMAFARRCLKDDAREHFIAIYLESRHRPIAYSVVSIGSANQSLVHPREVFQLAVLSGAVALVVAHNHPSGIADPSADDREVTQRLAKAGEILGIRLLDHVVFTNDGLYYSFAEGAPDLLR